MRNRSTMRWCCLATMVGVLATVGCAGTYDAHPPRSVYVAQPPPAPLPEMKSGPPAMGMDWIAGYWHYNGTDYVWIPGHWESPRAGLAWRPPAVVYSQQHRSWVYEHGRWEPAEALPQETRALR